MEMTEEKTAAESKGDEKSAGETVFCRCSKQLSMDRQECVKPDGHEPPCVSSTWWCVEHKIPRLGPDCLCIKCVDRAVTERWTESVGLNERLTQLVDEVGNQWMRIRRLEGKESDQSDDGVLVESYQIVTTLGDVAKLVFQVPVISAAIRMVFHGRSAVKAMEDALEAVERERVAIVRAEYREARNWLHRAVALYEDWKAKQDFYMKSSKLG